MLKQAKSAPDINNYLCFLMFNDLSASIGVNKSSIASAKRPAALTLKNNIRNSYKQTSPESQAFIRTNILRGLEAPEPFIRSDTGLIITEIIRQGGVMGWPEVMQTLLSVAGNESGTATEQIQEAATKALYKVCEDNKGQLCKSYENQCPLDFLVPRLLNLTSSSTAAVRANALSCVSVFIPDVFDAITQNLDDIISRLFKLSDDQSEEVRRMVCRALILVGEISPESLAPHMAGLADFIITQQRSYNDADLALEAGEFWLFASEQEILRDSLHPFLPRIVPVLLESMVYDEDSIQRLEDDVAEDAEQEDREQDIKPAFATAKGARNASNNVNNDQNGTNKVDDDELSEGEIDERLDDEDEPDENWSVRKCSAATLDVLSGHFHEAVFNETLPYLRTNLVHTDWPNREAAVLAIGAMAEGCMNAVQPHLPELIPFLVSLLEDSQPIVRQITCWSLGRYSLWASHLDQSGKQQFFLPMMDGILKRMLDPNKRVQEAAASAFASLEEKANRQLDDPLYCRVIVQQFAQCFARYKHRNMLILYDCVQTLAEHVGPSLQNPEMIQTLMPALTQRWETVSDQSRETFPLLECLAYVVTALGEAFAPYAGPVFRRCIKIIYQNLQDSLAAANNSQLDEPAPDFLVTGLDLLSAIIQAIPEDQSAELVTDSRPSMFDLLHFCMSNPNVEVRQSAYALLGDSAIFIFMALRPSLDKLIPILVGQLDMQNGPSDSQETGFAVTNNSCWSCGEIAMRALSDMEPWVETLLQRLYAIMNNPELPQSLHENAAIALGRLGNGCAETLAAHLATFGPSFLQSMSTVDATDEKIQSMKGMAEVASRNPHGLQGLALNFVNEISQFDNSQLRSVMGMGMSTPVGAFQKVGLGSFTYVLAPLS